MDPPPAPQPSNDASDSQDAPVAPTKTRTESFSQRSDDSQTAAEFIRDQEQLEADAREALPYSIENCTKPLGPLRQSVFACLTCNPPPANGSDPYDAAGVCYSCSVQCHGEHTLVEIFTKRNFTCDCGTNRFPATSPCALRINPATNTKGGVHSEEPNVNNKYNQNFRNRFCGCECDYDPFQQKGTMFQCLGLGTHETGGCGEDWWHPGCIVGLGPKWFENMPKSETKPKPKPKQEDAEAPLPTISEDDVPAQAAGEQNGDHVVEEENEDDDDLPPPPGFPADEEFEGFLCYKCVDSFPWIKRYAGTPGFLSPVFHNKGGDPLEQTTTTAPAVVDGDSSKKRKVSDDDDDETNSHSSKRQKDESETTVEGVLPSSTDSTSEPLPPAAVPAEPTETTTTTTATTDSDAVAPAPCKFSVLPTAPEGQFSLFLQEGFRDKICHCSSCFPLLVAHPQLLEEEEAYEPPVSDDGASQNGGGSTHGSGSLLERGESALRNVDRVRAIEGVMAYNHLKDKLTPFFKQFAESGQTISAEDIKEYFAKLRGDEQAIKDAGEAAKSDFREEQSGY
ncbi:putative zinc finger in N-recognin-domain-containing protein [Apodospora peruviana]|uniref:Zinc finger in N-recognin-domain-containing protein n=1 Tax=Apodospora peruviana TaxID=516989 RepID=A0AAE0MCY8_9PEZI|nr:putative zinc finger in N-recognin-domain-containing protein [Apodospora peruviana]